MNGLQLGGGALGVVGAVALGGGLLYRDTLRSEAKRVPSYEDALAQRTREAADAASALDQASPHDPSMSAEDAVTIARQRFGSGNDLMVASTGAWGDDVHVHVAEILPTARATVAEAAADAKAQAGRRATAVLRVGNWFVPAVLDQELQPKWHSREVPSHDRKDQYLLSYREFVPNQAGGIAQVATGGRGELLDDTGTPLDRSKATADRALDHARTTLDAARHSVAIAGNAGRVPMIGGGIAAALGAALLIAGRFVRE